MKLSPEIVSVDVSDIAIQLTLDQPIQEGELYTFEVADESNSIHNVPAIGKGNVITILNTPSSPRFVRYAWKDNPLQANVRSLSGLPMSSFELKINN